MSPPWLRAGCHRAGPCRMAPNAFASYAGCSIHDVAAGLGVRGHFGVDGSHRPKHPQHSRRRNADLLAPKPAIAREERPIAAAPVAALLSFGRACGADVGAWIWTALRRRNVTLPGRPGATARPAALVGAFAVPVGVVTANRGGRARHPGIWIGRATAGVDACCRCATAPRPAVGARVDGIARDVPTRPILAFETDAGTARIHDGRARWARTLCERVVRNIGRDITERRAIRRSAVGGGCVRSAVDAGLLLPATRQRKRTDGCERTFHCR